MSSDQAESPSNPSSNADFLSFEGKEANDGNARNFRQYQGNNKQFHPYNKNRNRNFNYRQNPGNNHDNSQFSPPNFSSPISNHQQQGFNGGGGFRGRPNYSNQNYHQNRNRNFNQNRRMGFGYGQGNGRGHGHGKRNDVPIQQYFHESMLEDPWADCHRFSEVGMQKVQSPNQDTNAEVIDEQLNENGSNSDDDNDERTED